VAAEVTAGRFRGNAQPLVQRAARRWVAATILLTVGAAAAVIALAPPRSVAPPEGLAFLLFVGSSVHVASTAWFYTVPEVRAHMRSHRARYVWWPLALIAGAGAMAVAVPLTALYWLLLPYFGWQFYHFQKQNLGIAALAASSLRIGSLTRAERRALTGAGVATVAGLLTHPSLLQLPVSEPLRGSLAAGPALGFALCVGCGLAALARRAPAERPAGFCLAYVTSLAFGLPVFVFASPYASVAALTVAHGLQYLLLMGLVCAGPPGGTGRMMGLVTLCNVALLGGSLLSLASDGRAGTGMVRALYGAYLGAVMAHFVIDAGLWRLRDKFPRALLASRVPYLVPAAGR